MTVRQQRQYRKVEAWGRLKVAVKMASEHGPACVGRDLLAEFNAFRKFIRLPKD